MTIDFHAHPVPDAFRKWLPLLNIDVIADDGFPLLQWSPDAHLQFMDEAGIDYTVLSLPTPHIHHGDDEKSLQAAMEINDELALPYVDGSIAGDPEPVALDMLRMVASDDRIVFGSAYPHSPAKVILMKKQRFDANPRWDQIRAQIDSGNGLVPMK